MKNLNQQEKIDRLQVITTPVRDFLKENFDPMSQIRVTAYGAEVLRTEIGTGVVEENDNAEYLG